VARGRRKQPKRRPRKRVETASYTDREGNVLTLRKALSPATIVKIGEPPRGEAASIDDAWQRREEMLFERLVVSWEVAGLPLDDQKLLLGRFRMASPEERRWVRATIAEHVETWIPGLGGDFD
jgi:hypothetical protein